MPTRCPMCGSEAHLEGIVFESNRGLVARNGKAADLTPTESQMFWCLQSRFPRLTTKWMLYNHLYGLETARERDLKTLDVMMWKLRQKLAPLDLNVIFDKGRGYVLDITEGELRTTELEDTL